MKIKDFQKELKIKVKRVKNKRFKIKDFQLLVSYRHSEFVAQFRRVQIVGVFKILFFIAAECLPYAATLQSLGYFSALK